MAFTQSRQANGILVIRNDGQLIVGNRHELKDLIQSALAAGDRKFLLDFSHTGYIDSSGLGALVTIARQVRLAGLNDDLRSLFELTKLDTLFQIAETPAQALAGF